MIKCIATDLDGTLLPEGSLVPSQEALELAAELIDKGILFTVASGRSTSNIKRLFWPVANKIVIMAENGCYVTYKGQVISKSPFEHNVALDIINDILSIEQAEVFVSYPEQYCLIPKSMRIVETMLREWKMTICALDSVDELHGEVFKVSMCMLDGLDSIIVKQLTKKWQEVCNVAVSGSQWLDFTIGDKGTGIKAIQKHFGLRSNEIAVFGDNYNDIPMFQNASVSYAMDTAVSQVKAFANHVCSNVEDSIRLIQIGTASNYRENI